MRSDGKTDSDGSSKGRIPATLGTDDDSDQIAIVAPASLFIQDPNSNPTDPISDVTDDDAPISIVMNLLKL